MWYNNSMKVLLTTLNAKYIHKNLALRWLYVASPIQETTYIKEYTIKEDLCHISEDILSMQMDAICFSCYIWNIQEILEIIRMIRQKSSVTILVGGPEVSFESEYLLDEGIDAICIGEGEQANWEYLMSLDHPHEIKGIMTRQFPNRTYAYSDLSLNEKYEMPYFLEMDQKDLCHRYFYLETSRGCPYRCEYCLSSTDNHVRMFSEEYVFQVLEKISKSSIKQVKLLDRTFNCMPARALKMARYMNEHCKNQIFQFEVVAETLSDDLLDFFIHEADKKRFRFEVGVQSFNPQTLSAVGRIQNNERLMQVMRRLIEAGCILHVDLIAGLPYEDLASFRHSFNTLYSVKAAELQCGVLKLLKGTSLKRKKDQYDFKYHELPPYDVISTQWLNEEEMLRIHDVAYACEKFHNSGKCRRSLELLLEKGYLENAFDAFAWLGHELKKIKNFHEFDLFELLRKLAGASLEVDAILLSDYMSLHKQKPKRLSCAKVSDELKKRCYDALIVQGLCTQNMCYNYGCVEYYYEDEIKLQVLVYNANHTKPMRYILSMEV